MVLSLCLIQQCEEKACVDNGRHCPPKPVLGSMASANISSARSATSPGPPVKRNENKGSVRRAFFGSRQAARSLQYIPPAPNGPLGRDFRRAMAAAALASRRRVSVTSMVIFVSVMISLFDAHTPTMRMLSNSLSVCQLPTRRPSGFRCPSPFF